MLLASKVSQRTSLACNVGGRLGMSVDVMSIKVVLRKPGRLLEAWTKLALTWFTACHTTSAGGVSMHRMLNTKFKLLF
jgi:hypothetical protein